MKDDVISRQTAIEAMSESLKRVFPEHRQIVEKCLKALPSAQPEQRWIPCGKCIHADGKHRWCKILGRSINEDYFCYWAEPYRGGGEADG